MLIFDLYMFYLDFIYFHVFCMIVSILGFIVKIRNPNFICSCVLVDPVVYYWITGFLCARHGGSVFNFYKPYNNVYYSRRMN
ncbi:hypothetical protein Hanom_Chr14g01250921 [Helianthus anomalus]